jgi:hypothetical protein
MDLTERSNNSKDTGPYEFYKYSMYCSSPDKTKNKFEVKGVHKGKYNCTQNFDWITSNEELIYNFMKVI